MLLMACWVLPRRRRPRAWSTARSPSAQPAFINASSHAGTRQAAECFCTAQASRMQGRASPRPRRRRATSCTEPCPLVNPATWLDVRAISLFAQSWPWVLAVRLRGVSTDADDLETLRKAFTFEPAGKK